jgi:lipopolysaccharide export LptBFGC system permease protein LptF
MTTSFKQFLNEQGQLDELFFFAKKNDDGGVDKNVLAKRELARKKEAAEAAKRKAVTDQSKVWKGRDREETSFRQGRQLVGT